MGFNTVAFLLNDFGHTLANCPKQVCFALQHPPMSERPEERQSLECQLRSVAVEAGEPPLHPQALDVLPTWHADWFQFFVAGGNCIARLPIVRYGRTRDGSRTVTLKLPDWWTRP